MVKLLGNRRYRADKENGRHASSPERAASPSNESSHSNGNRATAKGAAAKTQPADEPLPTNLSSGAAKDLVRLFKLLSDATRLRILHFLLQEEELHVRALCELLGQSQPAVSHHLSLLRVAGLIDARRQGKHNFYRLLPAGFEGAMGLISASVPHWRREQIDAAILAE